MHSYIFLIQFFRHNLTHLSDPAPYPDIKKEKETLCISWGNPLSWKGWTLKSQWNNKMKVSLFCSRPLCGGQPSLEWFGDPGFSHLLAQLRRRTWSITFSVKGQLASTSGFVDPRASVLTAQLCCSLKVALDNINKWVWLCANKTFMDIAIWISYNFHEILCLFNCFSAITM